MDDTNKIDPVEMTEEDRRTVAEAEEIAERQQYGQTGDMIDKSMGGMGGAGASGGMGPDLAEQSSGQAWNSSDLPRK